MANDYGLARFVGGASSTLVEEVSIPRSQVYNATHYGNDLRLSYRYRSFISFSFGGRWIEDFDLIATVDGDRMVRTLSGEFEDLTSTYDVLDGQFYHSTHFRSNSIHFSLATDGIDARKLESFKNWFAGGQIRELILAEHPNRAIMARVAQPPEMNVLPFEKEVAITIAGTNYTTSVTNYKGTIELELIMDEPFWYSLINVFGQLDANNNYVNTWDGVNFYLPTAEGLNALKEVLKIAYEDGIPLYSMIAAPMLFGNDIYAAAGGSKVSETYMAISSSNYVQEEGYHNTPAGNGLNDLYWTGGIVLGYKNNVWVGDAKISGAYIESLRAERLVLNSGSGSPLYLYYSGTAPAPIRLSFTIPIHLENNYYVDSINNFFVTPLHRYNSIYFESVHKLELRFTTPNFITSYNKVVYLFLHLDDGSAIETLRSTIRDTIRHAEIRKYAIECLNLFANGIFDAAKRTALVGSFALIFSSGALLKVVLDSKTGETIGTYTYNTIAATGDLGAQNITIVTPGATLTENVGDMVNSNYIMLLDRNVFDANMRVLNWTASHPDYSYKVTHDFPFALTLVDIQYKNLYY